MTDATGTGGWYLDLGKFGFPKHQNLIADGLSEYASRNPSEMLTEAFTEWKLSPNPRPVATAVGRVIDKYFKGVES